MNGSLFIAAANEDKMESLARSSEAYRQKAAEYSLALRKFQEENSMLRQQIQQQQQERQIELEQERERLHDHHQFHQRIEELQAANQQLELAASAAKEETEYWRSNHAASSQYGNELEGKCTALYSELLRLQQEEQQHSQRGDLPHPTMIHRSSPQSERATSSIPLPSSSPLRKQHRTISVGTSDETDFMVGHKFASTQTLLEIDSLERQLAEYQQKYTEVSEQLMNHEVRFSHELGKIKQELKNEKETKEADIRKREVALDGDKRTEIARQQIDFERKLEETSRKHDILLAKVKSDHQQKQTQLQEELTALQEKYSKFEALARASTEDYEETLQRLKREMEDSSQEKESLVKKVSSLEATVRTEQVQKESLEAKASLEIEQHKDKVRRIMEKEGEVNAQEINRLTGELEFTREERTKLQNHISALENKLRSRNEGAQERVTQLQVEMSRLLEGRRKLERELKSLRQERDELRIAQETILSLQAQQKENHERYTAALQSAQKGTGGHSFAQSGPTGPLKPSAQEYHQQPSPLPSPFAFGAGRTTTTTTLVSPPSAGAIPPPHTSSVMEKNRALWEHQAQSIAAAAAASPSPPQEDPFPSSLYHGDGEEEITGRPGGPGRISQGSAELNSLMGLLGK